MSFVVDFQFYFSFYKYGLRLTCTHTCPLLHTTIIQTSPKHGSKNGMRYSAYHSWHGGGSESERIVLLGVNRVQEHLLYGWGCGLCCDYHTHILTVCCTTCDVRELARYSSLYHCKLASFNNANANTRSITYSLKHVYAPSW